MSADPLSDLAPGARIVVAMSGGVDSSVVAGLLKEGGFDVVGVTLQLYDHGAASGRKGACCAGDDVRDARAVAARLDIPHYVLDYENRFREAVMQEFADAYLQGETPIPCIRCNERVKFGDLLATAKDLGGAALATGHYVRRMPGPQGAEMHRGVDPARDQSYFLFSTTQSQLDYLRFPLGGLDKTQTRALAARYGLPVAAKPDSQDICFVPQGRYADVVAKLRPEANEPGEIVDLSGRVLGTHSGVVQFTVGQRKGLGGGSAEPLYVLRIDAKTHRVVVGPRAALGRDRIVLRELNWLVPPGPIEVMVKARSAMPPVPARVLPKPDGGAEVLLVEPYRGIAPGQACVFYSGERVLGGGWIAEAFASEAAVAA